MCEVSKTGKIDVKKKPKYKIGHIMNPLNVSTSRFAPSLLLGYRETPMERKQVFKAWSAFAQSIR